MAIVDWGNTDSRRTYAEEEYCDRNGAVVLKEKIEAYWRARGHEVQVDLRDAGFHPAIRAARVDLRSNLRNGFPPGFKKSA